MKDQLIQSQKTFKLPLLSLMLVGFIIFMLFYLHSKNSIAESSNRSDLRSAITPQLSPFDLQEHTLQEWVKHFAQLQKHNHPLQAHSFINLPK